MYKSVRIFTIVQIKKETQPDVVAAFSMQKQEEINKLN